MFIETLVQDLRIGLRVLIEEKSFVLSLSRRAARLDPIIALRAE